MKFLHASVLALCFVCRLSTAQSAFDPCDPDLKAKIDPKNSWRYERRPPDQRCEGIYIKDVASSGGIHIVSLTYPVKSFNPETISQVHLAWKAPPDRQMHIRVDSLGPRVYYRLDQFQPSSRGQYAWPSGILASERLKSQGLGFLSWMDYPIAGKAPKLYVPLAVGGSEPHAGESAELTIVPTAEMKEMYLSVAYFDEQTNAEKPKVRSSPLGYGYYPANSPVIVSLKSVEQPGIYFIEISGTMRDGGGDSTSLWLYSSR